MSRALVLYRIKTEEFQEFSEDLLHEQKDALCIRFQACSLISFHKITLL